MSPDGEAIVTGAGDETLRFWNVFSKMRSTKVLLVYMAKNSYHLLQYGCNYICPTPPSLLGICVCTESFHQDSVVSSPLYYQRKKPGREFISACVKL